MHGTEHSGPRTRRQRSPLPAVTLLLLILFACAAGAATLRDQFVEPPPDARPRVWWHWLNGNISRDGIRADLEWMARSGIGGVHTVDIGLQSRQLVERPKPYPGPPWRAAIRYAADTAHRHGLEFGVFSSPGWSLTGGPWVEPAQAMKKLVWSSLTLRGGQSFRGPLPPLPDTPGPFQHVPRRDSWLTGAHAPPASFSADSVVVAYRQPAAAEDAGPPARVLVDGKPADPAVLADDDQRTSLQLRQLPSGKWPRIQYEYATPRTLRAITLAANPPGTLVAVHVREQKEGRFRPLARTYIGTAQRATIAFAQVSAAALRFTLVPPQPPRPFTDQAAAGASTATLQALWGEQVRALELFDIVAHSAPRIHAFEAKAGFQVARDYRALPTPPVPAARAVNPARVLDLTDRVQADGVLDWDVPPGDWVVLRMGYSLTGAVNHAAPTGGTGLEVDKFDADSVRGYMQGHFAAYGDLFATAGEDPGAFSLMVDSYEVGAQNWTDDILEHFARLRGYDPRPWLPTLTGVVVESAGHSDRFLWDFRRTLGELLVSEHYGTIADVARERGLTLYVEALESMRTALADDLAMRGHAAVPTAAMWTFAPGAKPDPAYIADIRGAASVAHVHGRRLVAAEVLTSALSPWAWAPRDLKPVVDLAFASGMNRALIHSSPHQPLDDARPGISLSIFGQQFTRHETWAEQSRHWIDYLARCSLLLQQGRAVADIAFFYGEDAPVTALFGAGGPAGIPAGYDFDYLGADALLDGLAVEKGDLVTAAGMRYRLLLLGGDSTRMTVPVLRRLRELAAAGARIVGDRPGSSPALADDPAEFDALVAQLWGPASAPADSAAGRIPPAAELEAVLAGMDLAADFSHTPADAALLFKHRTLPGTDIYFVSNPTPARRPVEARFRTLHGDVELWYPTSGRVAPAAYREQGGHTAVTLDLAPFESLFVVFSGERGAARRAAPARARRVLAELGDNWELAPSGHGAAPTGGPAEPGSWTDQPDTGLTYFSGTATYRTRFELPGNAPAPGTTYLLDLGDVRELAEIAVNGTPVATLWTPPFEVDITHALVPGVNTLEIGVTNLWVNRLIGDRRSDAAPHTVANIATYLPDAPLRPSGLLGPVRVLELPSPDT